MMVENKPQGSHLAKRGMEFISSNLSGERWPSMDEGYSTSKMKRLSSMTLIQGGSPVMEDKP